jgi:acyl-CoA reductase-like NAD-dependent aldehyde dehydrogenase
MEARAANKAAKETKVEHPRNVGHPDHKRWLKQVSAAAKKRWANMSAKARKERLTKMAAAKREKRAAAVHLEVAS